MYRQVRQSTRHVVWPSRSRPAPVPVGGTWIQSCRSLRVATWPWPQSTRTRWRTTVEYATIVNRRFTTERCGVEQRPTCRTSRPSQPTGSHRYRLTGTGLHHSMPLGHIHSHLLVPAWPNSQAPIRPRPVTRSRRLRRPSRLMWRHLLSSGHGGWPAMEVSGLVMAFGAGEERWRRGCRGSTRGQADMRGLVTA